LVDPSSLFDYEKKLFKMFDILTKNKLK